MGCSSLALEDGQIKDRLQNKRNAKRPSLEKMVGLLKKSKLCLDKCDFHWIAKDNERDPVIMCVFFI